MCSPRLQHHLHLLPTFSDLTCSLHHLVLVYNICDGLTTADFVMSDA